MTYNVLMGTLSATLSRNSRSTHGSRAAVESWSHAAITALKCSYTSFYTQRDPIDARQVFHLVNTKWNSS